MRWVASKEFIEDAKLFILRLHDGEFGFSVGALWLSRRLNYYYHESVMGERQQIYNL